MKIDEKMKSCQPLAYIDKRDFQELKSRMFASTDVNFFLKYIANDSKFSKNLVLSRKINVRSPMSH